MPKRRTTAARKRVQEILGVELTDAGWYRLMESMLDDVERRERLGVPVIPPTPERMATHVRVWWMGEQGE